MTEGLSGASLDRPALQLLLQDVRASRVDVIVACKRLRSHGASGAP
jgi:DNA invertase Pin-like site-specific DNA recombinase